jgi:hypothetical protein
VLTEFLSDFTQKIADRWATLLVLPGLVFTAAATVAAALGQQSWWDIPLLWRKLAEFTAAGAGTAGHPAAPDAGTVRTAVLLLCVLAVSVAAALAAGGLADVYERLLAGRWPGPLRGLAGEFTRRRGLAWMEREQACRDAREERRRALDAADSASTGEARAEALARVDAVTAQLAELEALRNDIALLPPARPTWTGDRMRALTERVRHQYGLDLAEAWPRLWLLLPDSTRQPLTESRERLDDAMRLGGWAVMYVLLGAAWWPSALAGVWAGLVAWRWSRERTDAYAELAEAAIDVHIADVLDRFDDETRPLRPGRGPAVTERFRKGAGVRHR